MFTFILYTSHDNNGNLTNSDKHQYNYSLMTWQTWRISFTLDHSQYTMPSTHRGW